MTKELVRYLAGNLVGDRNLVRVREETGKEESKIWLSVGAKDRGAIIGKEGRTIKALRVLVRTASINAGTRVQLELED